MLRELAFANALAVLTGLFYLVFILLGVVAPGSFKFLYNAQFFGADVASLLPRRITAGGVVATLATLVVTGWIFGYAWVWLYNTFARYF